MPDPTLSARIRAVQIKLNAINADLGLILDDAEHLGLAPFRVLSITHAILDNQHADKELNRVATALELTGANHKL